VDQPHHGAAGPVLGERHLDARRVGLGVTGMPGEDDAARRLPVRDGPPYRRGAVGQGLDDRGADAVAEGDAGRILDADRVGSQRPPLLNVRGEQLECVPRGRGDGDRFADRFDRGPVAGRRGGFVSLHEP
jgi:hypothetical protein